MVVVLLSMKATDWEFTNRALVFGLIFAGSFPLYSLDRQNSVAALASWLAPRIGADPDHTARFLFAFAALLLVMAALLRTWASAYLEAGVVYASTVKTEDLVADGPYRHTRNPLYFANILMAIGMGALMSRCCCFDGGVFLPADPAGRKRTAVQSGRAISGLRQGGSASVAFALTKNSLRRTPAELERWIQSRVLVLGIRRIQYRVRDNFEPESILRDIWGQHRSVLGLIGSSAKEVDGAGPRLNAALRRTNSFVALAVQP